MRMFVLFVLSSFVALSVFSQEEAKMPVSVAPKILSVVGTKDVVYTATRWPYFYKSVSDNPTCAAHLKNDVSNTYKGGYDGTQYMTILSRTINFKEKGLSQYKKTVKILVNWTVRVEGYSELINPWTTNPRLCSPWHGTSYQKFPSGDVMTKLYINGSSVNLSGEEFANIAKMTIPEGKPGSITNISDPTLVGSAVLKPAEFGGKFPDEITIEVKWYNDTSMRITTPDKMRNLVIIIVPM